MVHTGLAEPSPNQPRPGTVMHTTVGTITGDFVVGETAWTGNAYPAVAWEFVQDASGDVFRLERRAQSTIEQHLVCGCAPVQCGPYGSPCSACGSTSQMLYGPLPAGAHYQGDLVVEFAATASSLVYEDHGCVARACPPPPP